MASVTLEGAARAEAAFRGPLKAVAAAVARLLARRLNIGDYRPTLRIPSFRQVTRQVTCAL